MKKIAPYFFFLIGLISYSQKDWRQQMFDRDANFFEIQQDFYEFYNQTVTEEKSIPKGNGIKQFKRWEYYWEHRVDESGNFPPEGHVLQEMERYRNAQQSNLNRGYSTSNGNWEIVGPISLPSNGTGQLNGNGRLTCIAFHPTETNTIYAGAPSGGFWKSTDNGSTWTEFSSGLVRLGISSIAIHPTNPNIIYIGTGDRDAGDAPGYGVYRSTDGGVTWSARNNGMGNRTINEVLMHPTNSNILLAASSNGRIYKTTDGGANWSQSASLGINPKDIAYHPSNANIVYASGTEFHKSTDGGVTWSQITNGVPSGAQRIAIAVSANQPNWVYLLAGGGNGLIGIYRSTDSGTSFSTRTTTPNILDYATNGSGSNSQAWYDLVIAADPTNANIIYTGGINIWKSTDGGATMNCVSYWVGPSGGVDGVHADQHALEFSPHTNALYNGNDGGLYITSDGGTNWNDISSGLAIAQIYKIGVSQTTYGTVINGYQDNGTSVYKNETFVTEIGGDGMECIIDPTDDNYMYGALYYGDIRRSSNGGANFTGITGSISESGGWVSPYKLDPNNANTMYAGYDNVWKNTSVKTGTTWTQISNFDGTSNMVDLAIAPSNSNVMYASRSNNSFYRTTNLTAGTPTWTNITGNLPVADEPKDIEIDPNDPTHLFVAIGNNIYESTNSGNSWTDISGTLPNISLNTIIIDSESTSNAMYIGMDVGVYYKDDTLTDWVSFSSGLANVEITELQIYHNPNECRSKIYAATYGQGLWISDMRDPGNRSPKACFEASNTDGCIGNTFAFTDNSSYSPTSWTWTISPATYNFVNGTDANSQNPEVSFTAAGTYTISLTATNAHGSDTNTKTNYIVVSGGGIASAFNEDFESESACATASDCGGTSCPLSGVWTNLTNGTDDDIDWRIDSNGTPSSGTGPSVDYNPGTSAGKYAYTEASGCYYQTAILESDCMIIDQSYQFILGYHMSGSGMGSLHIDISDGGIWQQDVASISGNQGTNWNDLSVDLSSYVGNTIRIRIRGITGGNYISDIAIDDIRLVPQCSPTVWNGSSWSSGTPTINSSVTISGNYNTTTHGNFECCSLTIDSGRELRIDDSDYIVINNGFTNNGSIVVKNNGSLIQVNDSGVNVGNISYERTANIRQQDYVYWSSPIQNFNVNNVSPMTATGHIFKWNPTDTNPNGGQGYWVSAANEIMQAGKGYIVRGPSNFDETPQDYTATFTNGAPNNGVVSVPISRGSYTGVDYSGTNSATITRFDDNWNLIGNPYPSAISVLDFLNLNSSKIDGSVRIWTHGTPPSSANANPFYDSFIVNYSPSDYITHNGTGTVSGPNGFSGYIAGGQGFMVLMDDGSTTTDNVTFNNSLRNKLYTNDEFYRFSDPAMDISRIWINLSNVDGTAVRTLIGYLPEATDGKDRLYDAVTKVHSTEPNVYTFINADKMTIQAFALPFEQADQIPLGVNIPSPGNYTISIHAVEGIFQSETVILEDLHLNLVHNISQLPYDFHSEYGEINDRFVLRFSHEALSMNDTEFDENSITITANDFIEINSSQKIIKNVSAYDILGRRLMAQSDINDYTFNLSSIQKSNAVVLLKISLENNRVVYRKIVF